jgi:hypothetical protein
MQIGAFETLIIPSYKPDPLTSLSISDPKSNMLKRIGDNWFGKPID